jgi:uncharacterized membrane protein YoaT (DUF817 family)
MSKFHVTRLSDYSRYAFIVARCAAVGFALFATQKHSTGFYLLTRWIICATCLWGVLLVRIREWPPLGVVYTVIALLFNPFFPFHFTRGTWHNLDVIAAGILLGSIAVNRPPRRIAGKNCEQSNLA